MVDRRFCVRQPVTALVYIVLGQSNGGIILNISEGGLALSSAEPLDADSLARMRFQLPGSSDSIELSGDIAWISESKRKAGMRFVDISEDTRNRIVGWILSEATPVKFRPEGVGARETAWRRSEMPTAPMPRIIPPQLANPGRVTQAHAQVSMPTPNAAPTLFGARTSVEAPAPVVQSPRPWGGTEHKSGVEAGDDPRKILAWRRSWGIVAVLVMAGASFLTGWFTAGSGSGILGRFRKTKLEAGETANGVNSRPASSLASVPAPSVQSALPHGDEPEPLSSNTVGDFPGRPERNSRVEAGTSKPAPASRDANVVGSSVQIAHPQQHVLEPLSGSSTANVLSSQAENVPPPGPGSVVSQPKETSVTTSPSANVNQSEVTRAASAAESLPPKPAENPEAVKPSISVSFNFNPSIRVAAGLKPQMSQPGATLRIGQLLSRVDPVYPEEAETQQMEGTVELHAIIGQDGTVRSVEQRSGPALLVPAAVNAVRKWRYTPSYVDGQPVEAEEDITVTFRLPKQTAHPN